MEWLNCEIPLTHLTQTIASRLTKGYNNIEKLLFYDGGRTWRKQKVNKKRAAWDGGFY
jgi:hypothetical protein